MDFAVDFRIVVRRSGWAPGPLTVVFLHGLADHIRDLLITYPRPPSLDKIISLAIEVDQRLHNRHPHAVV